VAKQANKKKGRREGLKFHDLEEGGNAGGGLIEKSEDRGGMHLNDRSEKGDKKYQGDTRGGGEKE